MNRITVELTGTSPILHNNCETRGEDPGWKPKTDYEQAESRLFVASDGTLCLPWWHPIIALGRAAWSRGEKGVWPKEIVHAEKSESLSAWRVDFVGGWSPHRFHRDVMGRMIPTALPKFGRWSASFTLAYDPAYFKSKTLRDLLEHSGRHLGLPQFAPFAGPGPWGRFDVTKWEPVKSVALSEATA